MATETIPQHMRAIQRANGVRMDRAGLKRRIKAREVKAADVLRDPPAYVGNMPVSELLMAVPRVKDSRARKILGAAEYLDPPVYIGELRAIGSLTERERTALAALIETW